MAVAQRSRVLDKRPRRLPGTTQAGYWWYMLPVTVGFLAIVAVPFSVNIYYSLFAWKGGQAPKRWVGLGNYATLLHDERFWTSFKNSIFMIVAIVVIPTVIGLVLASMLFDYIAKKFDPKVASVLRAAYYVPQILPIAVAGILWSWVLDPRAGGLNAFLGLLGLQGLDWLGNPSIALPSVMLVLIWLQIGYPVVIFMSALQRIDPELIEAAELDGADWFRRFRSIIVPQIKPDIFVVVLTATVAAIKVFAPILVLTRGGPESSTYVPSYYSYLNFFQLSKVGYGAALANVLTAVILVVALTIMYFQRRSLRKDAQ